VRDVI